MSFANRGQMVELTIFQHLVKMLEVIHDYISVLLQDSHGEEYVEAAG